MSAFRVSELSSLIPLDLDAGQVFSGTPSGRMVKGFAKPCAYTPTSDPDYLFHESSRDVIVWFLNKSDPLYVYGPTGAGKTSLIKQLAARLNYPVFEVTGHGRLEFADLAGHLTVRDGNMTYEYGPLTLAMRYGGLFLFNELDLTSPDVAAGLNGILDGESLCLAENGGELVVPHPMFRFCATANTNGSTDETGLYQGTTAQNLAFMDRFWVCEVGYPAPEAEKELLGRLSPDLPETLREQMIQFAGETRKLFMGEGKGDFSNTIEVTLSTRTLLRWADLILRFQPLARQGVQPVAYALDRALGFRASRETRALLHELAQRIFPRQEEASAHFSTLTSELDDAAYLEQSLRPLVGSPLTDISNLPSIRLSTASNTAAGGKFWRAIVSLGGLELHWGRWNTVGQTAKIAIANCIDHDPVLELLNRSCAKIQNGYTLDRGNISISKELLS